MSTTVSYKGETITTVSNATKTLQTEGKYLEDDITLVDVSGGGAVLGTKNITDNGTYEAEDDSLDGYSEVTVAVPASAVDSGTKSITANGNNQDVVGYAAVNVNVPNTYSAGDEGKVVDNGALVSQTSDTVTTNDTYDTTLINSLTVNVSGGGGGISYDDIATRNYSGAVVIPTATTIKTSAFNGCAGITSIEAPEVTTIGDSAIYGNGTLTSIKLPKLVTSGNYGLARNNSANLSAIVLPKMTTTGTYLVERVYAALDFTDLASLPNNSLRSWYGNVLILRKSDDVCALGNTGAFNSSPFASGGTGGTLYVPQSLISSYQSASNWSTILGYANNQIKSIESTHTDPTAPIDLTLYYADGTLIPT